MTSNGVPLKVKVLGVTVIALLFVSVIGTAVEAVNLVITEDNTSTRLTRQQFSNESGSSRLVINSLKFVCPFH